MNEKLRAIAICNTNFKEWKQCNFIWTIQNCGTITTYQCNFISNCLSSNADIWHLIYFESIGVHLPNTIRFVSKILNIPKPG